MNTKPTPLTAAERQKLFRRTHTMVGLEKRLMTSLDDIGSFFAKELNETNVPRSMVLSRIILESHHRYCTPPAADVVAGAGVTNVPPAVHVSDIPEAEIEEVAVNVPPDPQVMVTDNVPAQAGTPVILATNNEQVQGGLQLDIRNFSISAPMAFAGGKLWKGEGDQLVVKLDANIIRKEFLKERGFACDYRGDKSWSKSCSSSELLSGLAAEVVAFMNAAGAD